MYDAIVIGARVAGSPTAMLLARKGYRVLMVDRAGFPSDIMSTHYIHQPGIARLKQWGLLDAVVASGSPPVSAMSLDFGPFTLYGSPPPSDGVAEAYAPRRTVLDQILVEAASRTGVEVREHFTVQELMTENGRITGIRGRAAGGPVVTESARLVIGADGMHSMVAKTVGAETYNVVPTRTCAYYSYWSGVPLERGELYSRPGQMTILGPTNNDQSLIINYWPRSDFQKVRTGIEDHFWHALDTIPGLAARVRAGERTERFRGSGDLRNYYRKPFGPGWALVGDAGYHKDPITAQGISDAFRDADLLSSAIDDGFAGRRSLDEALARYEQRRNEATMPIYGMTCDMASLQPPPPDQQQLIAALIGNQEQTNRFFGIVTGTVPIPEFFTPENIGQILGEAAHPA